MFLDLHKICCLHLTFREHVRVICDKWSKAFSSERRKKKNDEKRLTEIHFFSQSVSVFEGRTEFLKNLICAIGVVIIIIVIRGSSENLLIHTTISKSCSGDIKTLANVVQ